MEKIRAISLEQIEKMNKITASKEIIDAACETFVEVSTRIYNDTIPKNELDFLTNVFKKLLITKINEK